MDLEKCLAGMDRARVGLIGDLCLDVYWTADMKRSELSRETPHYPLPVVEERYAPGGCGNVAANMAALRPRKLVVLGVVGDDWRGIMLERALREKGVDTSRILHADGVVTNTYIKPLRRGISDVVYEDPRLDFENRVPLSAEWEEKILQALDEAMNEVDVMCVSDQMKCGCITPRVRERLCQWGERGKTVIVDSRDHGREYRNVIYKPNEVEAMRAFGTGSEDMEALCVAVSRHTGRTTLLTMGAQGCLVGDAEKAVLCPSCRVEGPIDFVGAGDTFLSGVGCALAGGADMMDAVRTAHLCSAVTIQKLGTTGTATRDEVRLQASIG